MASKLTESQFVQLALTQFAQQLIKQRQANVRAANATATEELLRSYDYEIKQQTTAQTAAAFIEFEEYGRFLDMRRLDRTQEQIPVEAIKGWILEKGLSAFRRKPKVNGRPLTGNRLLNAMAWGIVKKKRGRVRNKRKNIARGTEDILQDLISELREGYVDRTVDEIISSFQNKAL